MTTKKTTSKTSKTSKTPSKTTGKTPSKTTGKASKATTKRASTATTKPARATKRTSNVSGPPDEEQRASQHGVDAAIARGDAQAPNPDGSLPEGATHELSTTPDGTPKITRRRYSAA